MRPTRRALDCIEGKKAFTRFDKEVKHLLSVPHDTIAARERAYQEESERNPKRRGPKRKPKPSASGRASRAKG